MTIHIKVLLCAMFLFLVTSIYFGSYLFFLEQPSLISPLPDTKQAVKGASTIAILPSTLIPTLIPLPTPTALPTSTLTLLPTETLTPTLLPSPSPTPTTITIGVTADLEALFSKHASEYAVDKELLKKIAQCESGMNPSSYNTDYDYGGMFQFSASSWVSTRSLMGLSTDTSLRFNAEEAIRTAAFKISRGGIHAWPHCSQ